MQSNGPEGWGGVSAQVCQLVEDVISHSKHLLTQHSGGLVRTEEPADVLRFDQISAEKVEKESFRIFVFKISVIYKTIVKSCRQKPQQNALKR